MLCGVSQDNQPLEKMLIVQETQKWHWNFSRSISFYVMDQNSQLLFRSVTQELLGLSKF